jgi:hypothetical protein
METIFALATAAVAICAVCLLALYFLVPEYRELRKEQQKALRAQAPHNGTRSQPLPSPGSEPDQPKR